ncbi:Flp pilus assembly protein CpaB [Ornithinimicrobium cavernae]|uniref:Flp pilus assembly protein CpaB n=1 Tax=Ornithinimicrobium cavernae TaxID=2666047 RepID=UPI000D6859FD|nr:hypothetical protein [Ornithinimicrobium cavernae]
MIRRIIAAFAALILAAVGIFLVMSYASTADERAMADLETVDTLVATAPIPEGTPSDQLGDLVKLQPVPAKFLVDDAVDDVDDLEGELLTTSLVAGEQLTNARFATAEEIRARADFELPDEAKDLHQVTIPLETPRALGGNIAPGDTVGVFISVEPKDDPSDEEESSKDELSDEQPSDKPEDQQDGSLLEGGIIGGAPSMTHLELHKVLVVDVTGSRVEMPEAPPSADSGSEGLDGATGGQEQTDSTQVAREVLLVTLALEAPQAEKLVYGMEFGTIWLSMEPEGASEENTRIVVTTVPRLASEIRDIYEEIQEAAE